MTGMFKIRSGKGGTEEVGMLVGAAKGGGGEEEEEVETFR